MKIVYVAGAYSGKKRTGWRRVLYELGCLVLGMRTDEERNVLRAIAVANELMDLGFGVIVPHLSHHLHAVEPREYEWWMAMDFELLERCDAVFRMEGPSSGADREVALARDRTIPVFRRVCDLELWAFDEEIRDIDEGVA